VGSEQDDEPEDETDQPSESVDEVRASRLKRKQLTKKRIVNSIDKCLNIENYNPFPIPKVLKKIKSIVKVDRNPQNDIVRVFQNIPPTRNIGRNNSANVITGRQGPQPKAKDTPTPLAAFNLFFTKDMMTTIVSCTNRRIRSFISKLPENFIAENNKYLYIKETCIDELNALIGLYIYRGLYKLNTLSVTKLFSNTYGPPIFSAVMSRNRFTFIRANLCFDDASTRDDRWKQDRFAAIRDIFESLNFECMSCLVPSDYLSLDETLYPMRNQICFKQYNPKKPAKYGLLFKAINAARYPYTYIASPYCGKPQEDGGKYYIQGTEEIVKQMIERLLENKVSLAGRNISFDRLYTSISIQLWLYEKNITSLGTMQLNRKGIPAEMLNFKHREVLSTEVYWQSDGPLSMSSYVVQTASGKKNVVVLSTLNQILGTTKDDNRKKLALYKLYDFTKGGTDIVDQRMAFHTCKTKSRKWTTIAFAYMIDTARVNSSTIYALNKNVDPVKQKSFEYGFELVMQLVKPHIARRNQKFLPMAIKQKIQLIIGDNSDNDHPDTDDAPAFGESRKRCTLCQKGAAGMGYTAKKKSIKCVKSLCQLCGNPTCQEHLVQKCKDCEER
jgi:hypothetical protein